MLIIGILALITIVGFGLVLVATVVVTTGVRQEEHYWTLRHRRAPSLFARLARVVLSLSVRKHDDTEPIPDSHPDDVHPDDVLPWYQRSEGWVGGNRR